MTDLVEKANLYFSPRAKDFWRWAEHHQVIEWSNGKTICYRNELIEILKELQPNGLAPLESILLILSACKPEWEMTNFRYLYDHPHMMHKGRGIGSGHYPPPIDTPEYFDDLARIEEEYDKIREQAKPIIDFLKRIQTLPLELRSGHTRIHLLKRIFSRYKALVTPNDATFFIKELESGRTPSDRFIASSSREYQLVSLDRVFTALYDIEDLELYISTGLEQTPEPAPLPIPEPVPSNDNLLTQLSQDPQTAGLARLTKRLIAALNIPPHTHGASDQPLGGVSDISNRGDFDRLLLSELANDDDTLSARLVNNEALYLRRETPPDPQVQERVILVDTSLRLWGTPRVFAVSAALGCALNNHQKAGISAFALGKELIGPNALAKKEEVIHFLEQQSPVLHSGEALRAFSGQQPRSAQKAVFFITSEEVMADKNFSLIFAEQQQHLDYLLVLSRTGTFMFYKLVNGLRSLMSTSVFDLEELLFEPKKSAMLGALIGALNPQSEHAIKHYGLLLPSYPGKLKREDVAFDGTVLVAVLPSKRVWFWHSAQKGAIEVLNKIEDGECTFFLVNHELKCIVVRTKDYKFISYLFENNELTAVVDLYAKLIRYHPQQNVVNLHEIDGQVVACAYEEGNIFIGLNHPGNPTYYYHHKNITHVIELSTHTISPLPEKRVIPKEHILPNLHPVKKMVNNGYSVLRNITEIGFTPEGFIQLGQHQMILRDGKLWLTKASSVGLEVRSFLFEANLDSQFYTRSCTWPNGSKVTLDSRGFLLFFWSGSTQADFTIALIIGQELAASSKNGYYTGNHYFYNASRYKIITPTDFYNSYIVSFIKRVG